MASVSLTRRPAVEKTCSHRHSSLSDDDDDINEENEDSKNILTHRSMSEQTNQRKTSVDPSPMTPTSPNRFKHLCSRLKRRFTLTKDHHEDLRHRFRLRNYRSFSTSIDDTNEINHSQRTSLDFQWPDFEKIYDSIPPCLINALPGLDDSSLEENDDLNDVQLSSCHDDRSSSIPMRNAFLLCQRGGGFRRNAICSKVDKIVYHGQLDTFIQQLMIEKLMRTWT